MKGDYIEEEENNTNMFFAKLNQHQHQHQHQHHYQTQHHQQIRERQNSEEEESRSSGANINKKIKTVHQSNVNNNNSSGGGGGGGGGGDGATIEVVRRPRGRPPGSKNKPKPPLIITRDIDSSMRPFILELPRGLDIVESLARFTRRRNVGLCVLTGSGTVANVSLRQPSTTPGAGPSTLTFHGHFDILSISATFLPPPSSSSSSSATNTFTISLAGPQGQIVGGCVAGTLLAAGTVFIVAASFNNPSYQRLPIEDDFPPSSVSGDAGHQPRPTSSAGEDTPPPPQVESCAMSIYSCHLPPDVIWPPTARPPPPPF